MIQLLAIEWLKIKRYRTFWIIAGLFLLLLFVWNYEASVGNINIGNNAKKNHGISIVNSDYSFPQAWANTGYWGSVFILFMSILVIILTTNEYAYRTNRQNVIDGWSRTRFYHAKVLMVVVLSVMTTLCVVLIGGILGWMHAHNLHGFFTDFHQVGYFFLLAMDYLGLALFLSLLIKRSGLAIGLFLLYAMIVELLLVHGINSHMERPYGDLLFLQASDELLPFPFPAMIKMAMGGASAAISMRAHVVATIGWCGVYYIGGRLLLLRRDW